MLASPSAGAERVCHECRAQHLRNRHAAWLALYNADRSNWIRVGGAAGAIQRRNGGPGLGWEDVTGIVSGRCSGADSTVPGPAGPGVPDAGGISSADVREQLGDHIDSLLSGPDIQATDSSIVVDRSTPGA